MKWFVDWISVLNNFNYALQLWSPRIIDPDPRLKRFKSPFLEGYRSREKKMGRKGSRRGWTNIVTTRSVIDNPLGTDSNSLTTQGIHFELLCKSSRKSFLDSFPRDARNHFLPFSEIAGGVNRPKFYTLVERALCAREHVKSGLFILDFSNNFCRKFKR